MQPLDEQMAGIVLAGGQSSRMGRNKALLPYRGRLLIEHMTALLRQAGCVRVYISGAVPGYESIPDNELHAGPGRAMADLLRLFQGRHNRLMFVPVDMPLIGPPMLAYLAAQADNSFFDGYPLPACLATGDFGVPLSVKDLLNQVVACPASLPPGWADRMVNANTPQTWKGLAS